MISIKFGILLVIRENTKKNVKNEKRSGKSKGDKSSKASKKSKNPSKPKKEQEPKPKYAFQVDKPQGFFHIEYAIMPGDSAYSIDVVYWDTISKIFTNSGSAVYRNYINNGRTFIPIMLQHEFPSIFDPEELLKLQSYSFDVLITTKKNKLSSSAKSEKGKIFYTRADETDLKNVVQAFEWDPNILLDELIVDAEPRTQDNNGFMSTTLYVFENDILAPKINKIIQNIDNKKGVSFKEYVPVAPEPNPEPIYVDEDDVKNIVWKTPPKKGKGGSKSGSRKGTKSGRQSKKSRKNKGSDIKIQISGESFITDPTTCVYKLNEATDIVEQAYVIFSVDGLLHHDLNLKLQPFIIKLKTLKNIPADLLKNERFSSLHLKYDIPWLANSTTKEKEIAENISINESHVFFNMNREALIEFLQSQRLCIQLLGMRKDNQVQPQIFGTQFGDYKYEQITDPANYIFKPPNVLILATVTYDLSLLLKDVYFLKLTSSFRHPSDILAQEPSIMEDRLNFLHTVTINDINLKSKLKPSYNSPLDNGTLIEFGTCLNIEVKIYTPIYGLTPMLSAPHYFKRLLLIIYLEEVAMVLLNEILLQNQPFTYDVVVPNYFLYSNRQCSPNLSLSSNYCREMIWSQVKNLNESVCKILYNSEHVFTQRIYKKFLTCGGLYKIVLKCPLQDIFQVNYAYLQINMPKRCLQCLQKLELLLRTPTMREVNQFCLLPTSSELVSFNMEFGIAYRISV